MLGEKFPTPKHVINKDLEETVTSSYEFEEGNLAHPVLATCVQKLSRPRGSGKCDTGRSL